MNFEFIDQNFDQASNQPYNPNNTEQTFDLLFTDEHIANDTDIYNYQPIGEFEVIAAIPHHHPLIHKHFLTPQDFIEETLLTPLISSSLMCLNYS